jgi:hypothetical protein
MNWHVNGTRHIDHFRLVVAIHGLLDETAPPTPGATPAFVFKVKTTPADGPRGPSSATVIEWSSDCVRADGGGAGAAPALCEGCTDAAACSVDVIPTCAGRRLSRRLARVLASGCDLARRAGEAPAAEAERLSDKAARRWRRAAGRLERPRLHRGLSAECVSALTAALEAAAAR